MVLGMEGTIKLCMGKYQNLFPGHHILVPSCNLVWCIPFMVALCIQTVMLQMRFYITYCGS
jgi:hypothetical protein